VIYLGVKTFGPPLMLLEILQIVDIRICSVISCLSFMFNRWRRFMMNWLRRSITLQLVDCRGVHR